MKYILSFGGGLNSTALLVYLVKNNKPLDLVIFADTGNEFEYTYKNVEFYKKWTESYGIEFQIVRSSYGKDLYNYCWDKKIVPSRWRRDCTTKFKISPMRKYIRNIYGKKERFIWYIGIDLDESHRMRDSDVKYATNTYPLVEAKINRNGCKELLEQEGLPVPEKSGCWFCPFTKKQNWLDLITKNPDLFERSMLLEQNSAKYPEPVSLLSSKPLIKVRNDASELIDYEHSCDVAGSCFL